MSSIIPCHNGIKLESNRKAIRKFIIHGDYAVCVVNIKVKEDVKREIRNVLRQTEMETHHVKFMREVNSSKRLLKRTTQVALSFKKVEKYQTKPNRESRRKIAKIRTEIRVLNRLEKNIRRFF